MVAMKAGQSAVVKVASKVEKRVVSWGDL